MDILGIFSAFGLSASAGLNAYIPLLVVSLMARFTNLFHLSPPWDVMESWWVIGALVVLIIIEFFADKIPAVNHINDVIQTFIRPSAGAVVFAASAKVITDVHPVLAAILGLLVAGGVHVAKSAVVRPAVTATTAGTANAPVSVLEDVVSTLLSIISTVLPILVAILMGLLITWLLWRAIKRLEST